jgi:hypothetical protein
LDFDAQWLDYMRNALPSDVAADPRQRETARLAFYCGAVVASGFFLEGKTRHLATALRAFKADIDRRSLRAILS